jgi:hypothetical protein
MHRRLVHHEKQECAMKKYLPHFLPIILFALSGVSFATQAGDLGRLFFTPQQREQLDFEQNSGKAVDRGQRNYIIVNGVVQRNGGERTVWINGTAQPVERSDHKNPTSETVIVPGKSRPVKLKVGEPLPLQAPAPAPDENQ